MFINPTKVERVTSGFRGPGRLNHHGVDFAQAGTHEIYAVADGTVSRSYTSASYGECIMIVHIINGQAWESVYAHLRSGSRKVREGQKVKQGQVIGIMGNTGQSTGQHLHFELHKGYWNIQKSNAVNPLDYLGKPVSAGSVATKADKELHLPKSSDSWRVYPTNKTPVKGNEKGFLNPKKFGGLTYDILANPQKDVYTIKTGDFGTVNIYAAASTGAKVVAKKVQAKNTVHLPASAKTWRTYKLDVQPVTKNSDWSLTPSKFGGLTYEILGRPYPDVVTINTSKGKRNIYVGKGTGAVIK